MKEIKLEQGSEEWLEYRRGKSGGSLFGKLYKIGGRKNDEYKAYFYSLLAERVARPMTPNDYMDRMPEGVVFSWAVRGQILEPEAATAFEKKTGKKLEVCGVWEGSKDSFVSPDRVIRSKDGKIREAVEIKCLSSEKVLEVWHNRAFSDKSDFECILNNDYKAQVLKYFMVNKDLELVYWVVYTDLIPNLELQVLTVSRDEVEYLLEDAEKVEKLNIAHLKLCEKMLDNAIS